MKFLLCVVGLALARYSQMSLVELEDTWASWKHEHSQEFGEEDRMRFGYFVENLKLIEKTNDENNTFVLKMNKFGAMSQEEFARRMACMGPKRKTTQSHNKHAVMAKQMIPASIDWSVPYDKYVTPVKNQGSCGSCWAFSTTGDIEARAAIAGHPLVSLSEQELIDCSKKYGNQGCNGGLMDNAFKYVEAAGGLCSEAEYPYTGKTGLTCKASQCAKHYDAISTYRDVDKDDEAAMESAVATGPVSVAVEADQLAWQFYHGGVIKAKCGDRLDHGVLVVGYGTDSSTGTKFWKVKNSWGSTWGESGYVRICRDCNKDSGHGECGIRDDPSYAVSD